MCLNCLVHVFSIWIVSLPYAWYIINVWGDLQCLGSHARGFSTSHVYVLHIRINSQKHTGTYINVNSHRYKYICIYNYIRMIKCINKSIVKCRDQESERTSSKFRRLFSSSKSSPWTQVWTKKYQVRHIYTYICSYIHTQLAKLAYNISKPEFFFLCK